MPTLREAFAQLDELYAQVSPVPCRQCGECCVTPHMTLVEFAYLLDAMLTDLSAEQMIHLLNQPMDPVGRYPGNFVCRIQNEHGFCQLHTARSLSCRIEGMPVLETMELRSTRSCSHITQTDMPGTIEPEQIDAWINHVFQIIGPFCHLDVEPYWLNALNLECWFSVALDPGITQDPFLKIRSHIRQEFDLGFLEAHYRNYTQFAEKLDLIDSFFQFNRDQDCERALTTIRMVVEGFPRTGSYYQHEGQKYLQVMDEIVNQEQL